MNKKYKIKYQTDKKEKNLIIQASSIQEVQEWFNVFSNHKTTSEKFLMDITEVKDED